MGASAGLEARPAVKPGYGQMNRMAVEIQGRSIRPISMTNMSPSSRRPQR